MFCCASAEEDLEQGGHVVFPKNEHHVVVKKMSIAKETLTVLVGLDFKIVLSWSEKHKMASVESLGSIPQPHLDH